MSNFDPSNPLFSMGAMLDAMARGSMSSFDRQDITELKELLLDRHGYYVKSVPADTLTRFNFTQRCQFCVEHGVYQFVTDELVEYLNLMKKGMVIEVGSGNGLLAKAMGIPATDNFMQDRKDIQAHYARSKQATIKYGREVLRADAIEAKRRFKADTIIGAWVTGKKKLDGSPLNNYGPDLVKLAKKTTFILMGNGHTHADCALFAQDCWEVEAPWILSRAQRPELNRMWVWGAEPPAVMGAKVTFRKGGEPWMIVNGL